MSKSRKSNKWLVLFTLFVFLMQVVIPPALFARIKQGGVESGSILTASNLFHENVPIDQQILLFEFIQYVTDSFEPREGLRAASEKLANHLKSDQFWFDIDISDQKISELIEEANASRRYLIQEVAPVEERLHAEQRRIEKQLLADSEHISRTGDVPDGFMERNQGLSYLYDLQDDLWEMKIALLHEVASLSDNVINNYLSKYPEKYAQKENRSVRSLETLGQIIDFAVSHHYRLVDLKAGYEDSRQTYNRETASSFYKERSNTLDLINIVAGQSDSLKQQDDPNAGNHAELLDAIIDVLKDRINRIDQQLGELGVTESYPNPLYVAPGLGVSDETRKMADDYRAISRNFILQTHQKTEKAKALKSALADMQKKLKQEHLFFQTVLSDYGDIISARKSEIISQSTDIVDGFSSSLDTLQSELDEILLLAAELDFEKPDVIIGSKAASSKAFRLNRAIEQHIASAGNVEQISIGFEIRLYSLLADVDIERAVQLTSHQMLEKSSHSREKAVDKYSQQIEGIKGLFAADAMLAEDLKDLGRNIMAKGEAFFQYRTNSLARFLDKNGSAAGQPYFDYLAGAHEQLEHRLQTIKKINAVPENTEEFSDISYECPECVDGALVWPEMAEIGNAYSESLQQIDDLADIESFYSKEKIQSDSVYVDAHNIFELNKRLGNQPYLHLNPSSIDVVFIAGSQMVVIKGIGDPNAVDSVTELTGTDYLLETPYIASGGFLQNVRGFGDRWVKPIGRSAMNTASGVISSAAEVGGRLVTTTGHYSNQLFEGAKAAVQIVGDYSSIALSTAKKGIIVVGTGAGDVLGNTWNNAVKNDDGSYSWLKIGTYAVGGVACGAAIFASAGVAAPACVGLLISGGVNLGQGVTDTVADYGWISERTAKWTKLGFDIAGVIGGGYYALHHTLKHTPAVIYKMGRFGKTLVRLGVNPNDVKNLTKIGTLPFRDVADAISTGFSVVGWGDRLRDWYRMLPDSATPDASRLIGIFPDLSTSDFIRNMHGVVSSPLYMPGLPVSQGPNPMLFNPFSQMVIYNAASSFASLHGPFGNGSGVSLPGAGVGVGEGAAPGYSLLPVSGDASQPVSNGSGDHKNDRENPHEGKESPYKDWESPYKGWESPYKGWKSPYKK